MKIRVEVIEKTFYLFEVEAENPEVAVDDVEELFNSDEFDPDEDCVGFSSEFVSAEVSA